MTVIVGQSAEGHESLEFNRLLRQSGSEGESDIAECCFTSTETVGLLGTGAQDDHLDLHTAPEL